MIDTRAYVLINGIFAPVELHTTQTTQAPPLNWNEELKRLRNTTITCELHTVEAVYQPTGPVVEGTLARVERDSDAL